MADISKNTTFTTRVRGRTSYPVANGVTLYPGALVQLNTTGAAGIDGCLDHWDKTGQFMGICVGGDVTEADGGIKGDSSLGAASRPHARVDESGVILTHINVTGATQPDVGAIVYANDSDPTGFTKTRPSAGVEPVGRLVRLGASAADCDVELFTPAEFLAGIAGTTWTV